MTPSFIATSSNGNYSFQTYNITPDGIQTDFYKEKIDELDNPNLDTKGRASFCPFGITKDENIIYVSSHLKIGMFDAKTYEYLGLVEGVASNLNTHQILIDGDLMYICNTSNDSLGILNLKTKENKYVMLKDDIENGFEIKDSVVFQKNFYAEDMLHFNSLCQHKDSLFLLFSVRGLSSSKVLEISKKDYQPIQIIEDFGTFNHDIVVTDESIYSVSTHTGELIEYCRKTQTFQRHLICRNVVDWWPRGLKKIDDTIYVFVGENFKSTKKFQFNIVREFDLIDKKIRDTHLIPLIGSIYQII
jgi:hypothetical protein